MILVDGHVAPATKVQGALLRLLASRQRREIANRGHTPDKPGSDRLAENACTLGIETCRSRRPLLQIALHASILLTGTALVGSPNASSTLSGFAV